MRLVYLDSNQSFRVFEREKDRLLEPFTRALTARSMHLASSDVILLEVIRGLHAGAPRQLALDGLDRLQEIASGWFHLNSLRDDELRCAFDDWKAGRQFAPLSPLLAWSECAERIRGAGGLTPRQLAERQKAGAVAEQELKEFEARTLRGGVLEGRQIIANKVDLRAAEKHLFLQVSAHAAEQRGATPSEATLFAAALWKDKNAAPSWRMTTAQNALVSRDNPRPDRLSGHLDLSHAVVAPYVACFISEDGNPRDAIERFNRSSANGVARVETLARVEQFLSSA